MICNALVWSFDVVTGLPWLEVIRTLAPVVTAVIAWLALRNWQRQDKAKREAEFLDQMVEVTLAYVAKMATPISHLELTRAGFRGYQPSGGVADKEMEGAIAYITKRGPEDAQRMLGALNSLRPTAVKLDALAAKGQIPV